MTNSDSINKFINGFKPVKDFFLNGYCYWFAKLLEDRFNGVIYYMPIKNHFISRINGHYYDANGKIEPDETVYLWSVYEIKNPIEAKRITKYCINKEEN